MRRRGSALVVALLLLTAAQALVLAVTTRAIAAAHAARRVEARGRALNAAEAGLADAVQRLWADGTSSGAEGRLGTCAWEVEADEELAAPFLSVATFTASGRCGDQAMKLRLRMVVERDDLLALRDVRRLDWAVLP